MTKKRFVKFLMSHGIQRNDVQEIARRYNLRGIPYSKAFKDFLLLYSIKTSFRNLGEAFNRLIPNLVNLQHSFNRLKDSNRMTEAENKIMALSSCAFVKGFNDVARLICNARTDAFADTYCSLAETAVELLAKGEEEKDVLYYFDKLYAKETVGEK